MEIKRKTKVFSVSETPKLSKEKVAKLKKLSKKIKSTNQNSATEQTGSYHY